MISLPPICDRAAAAAHFHEFAEALGAVPLVIDASRVDRIGQAMLQVLVSAARSEGGIALHAPSAPFMAALQLTGLDRVLIEGTAS
jgi:anti-anti-sigma regulatory factor